MTKKVDILLLEDIPNLGEAGSVVSVNEGHARNFLFPQGKAALADSQAKKRVADKAQQDQKKVDAEVQAIQDVAESLEGTELTIEARLKDGEDIFGSVTATNICQEINKQANLKLAPKQIDLKKPLTKVGAYDIVIKLSKDVDAQIKLSILADPDSVSSHDEE